MRRWEELRHSRLTSFVRCRQIRLVDFQAAPMGRLSVRRWMGGFLAVSMGGWFVDAGALVGGEPANVNGNG